VVDQLVSYIILQSKQRKQSFYYTFSTSGRSCRHRNPTVLCERVELLVARQRWKNLAHPREDLRRSKADLPAGGRGMDLHALLARRLMEAARHGPRPVADRRAAGGVAVRVEVLLNVLGGVAELDDEGRGTPGTGSTARCPRPSGT
jgi:hypothetical protein